MTILVDSAIWPGRGLLWCHLVSDISFDELHTFAGSVGLSPRAFERDHYDVPSSRRIEMIEAGALPVSSRELVARLIAAGLRRRKGGR